MPVKWQRPDDLGQLPPKLSDWLLNTGSLTERLQALTSNFSVNLLGQETLEMDESEAQLLNHTTNKAWQIREVVLQGSPKATAFDDANKSKLQDWVFARSVLPNDLCNSKWNNLGSQPLGKRIFNDQNFVRSGFEIGQLQCHPLTGEAFKINQACWARRSKFTIGPYNLIVAEAFLPSSPCYW